MIFLKNLAIKVLVLVYDFFAHKSIGDTICDAFHLNYHRYSVNNPAARNN